jgi:glycosyltransferase involved in cell wall biosynthesis
MFSQLTLQLMPQTTVLIPTYNCAKYLAETINSILAQCYSDYEILILDDGSTDHTENLIAGYKQSNIIYYKNETNLGIVASLNKGIALAKGKYIARMDADDIILGNRLQLQIDFLEKNKDYGMVGGWYQVMDESGKFIENVPLSISSDMLRLGLLFRNQFAHPAVTMRTHLAKKLCYDQDFIYCEDFDLWSRFAEVSKIANIPSYFLSYRWYANNTCNLKQKELRSSVTALLSRELDKIGVQHSAEELMLHVAVCFGLGKKLFYNDDKRSQLKAWHDKIFKSQILNKKFSPALLDNFRQNILNQYCGIPQHIKF